MKRWIISIMLLVLLIPWMLVRVEGATIKYSGTCGTSTGWYIDSDYNLFIYGSGAVSTSNPFKSYKTDIVSVTVQEGVTSLDSSWLFDGLINCTSFSLPSTLTAITASWCFSSCHSLSTITIPNSVTKISGTYAFEDCTSLTSFTFPASITTVGQRVFEGCTSLTDLYFVSSTPPSSFGSNALEGCSTGLKIHVPAGAYDAYCAAIPAYSAFIVADSVGSGGGSGTGGGVSNNGYMYSLYISHEQKNAYYWDSGLQFTAQLLGGDLNVDRSVTWSVTGSDPATSINSNGFLTIGPKEYQLQLTVTATSVAYPSLIATSTIPITQSKDPSLDDGSGDGDDSSTNMDDVMIMLSDMQAYIGQLQVSVDAANEAIAALEVGSTDLSGVTDAVSGVQDAVGDVQTSVEQVGDTIETLPNQIQDSMVQVQEQEKTDFESQGNDSADALITLIPDDSEGFLESLSSLVQALSYDGTDAVLEMPAITIPGISGLFSEFTVLEAQEINFKDFFDMMPFQIITVVRALFDIAVVLYCVKELLSLVQAVLSGDFSEVFQEVSSEAVAKLEEVNSG